MTISIYTHIAYKLRLSQNISHDIYSTIDFCIMNKYLFNNIACRILFYLNKLCVV